MTRLLLIWAAAATAAAGLSGCNKTNDAAANDVATTHGRFAGVGVTDAGVRWSRAIIANRPAKDPDAAKTALDDHVIVVVDTTSGAIRQCGDISGYCIGERTLDPTSPTRAVDVAKLPDVNAAPSTPTQAEIDAAASR